MTHPITPPPELVREWIAKFWDEPVEDVDPARGGYDLATRAAQWGADIELEACCMWLANGRNHTLTWEQATNYSANLRAARRPKPLSLKEQALAELDSVATAFRIGYGGDLACDTIRRALEQLDD